MKNQKGFSLIELMVVVAVIGVLTAIAIPAYQNYIQRAEASSALATLRSLQSNIEDYIMNEGKFPADASDIGSDENAFKYGIIALTPVKTGTGTAAVTTSGGTAAIEFNSGSINGKTITLARANTGVWSCYSDLAANQPKGCSDKVPTPPAA